MILELTLQELAYITHLVGKQTGDSKRQMFTDICEEVSRGIHTNADKKILRQTGVPTHPMYSTLIELLEESYDKYIGSGKLAVYYRVPKFDDIPKHRE